LYIAAAFDSDFEVASLPPASLPTAKNAGLHADYVTNSSIQILVSFQYLHINISEPASITHLLVLAMRMLPLEIPCKGDNSHQHCAIVMINPPEIACKQMA
jgi:hypothetical protein